MGAYKIFKKYIDGTEPKIHVPDVDVIVSTLTTAVAEVIDIRMRKAYITARTIKHLYDGKPDDEFNAVLKSIPMVVRFPDHIHLTKDGKRGDFIFKKNLKGYNYICSLEQVPILEGNSTHTVLFVVTCFWERSKNYLNEYPHVWSWKDDIPSS